jgi:hypothetical protein
MAGFQFQLYLVLYLKRRIAKGGMRKTLKKLVGTPRFELGTPCTPCKCATRLRHVPS